MDSVDKSEQWKFWPVILIAFLYPVNNGLIGLAIPLYFFQEGLSVEFIGILASGSAMTYMFSPILFNKLSERIGRKKGLTIAITGTGLSQVIFYITLSPIPFLISRLMEGLFMGMYWANLQSSMSDNSLHDHRKMMARYNIAWNTGLLTGLITGAIFLFFIDQVGLIFYIAPIFLLIDMLVVVLLFQESSKITLEDGNNMRGDFSIKEKEDSRDLTNYIIPLIIPVLLILLFGLSKATVNFLYPLKSEILGFGTYSVYILSFIAISAQLLGTSSANYISIKNLKRIASVAVLVLGVIVLLFGIIVEFWMFIVLYIILGFLSGLLYGFGLRIFIHLNIKEKTSKYTSLCESMIGSIFFIVPVVCGIIASVDLVLTFYIMSSVILILFIVILNYIRKLERNLLGTNGAHSGSSKIG